MEKVALVGAQSRKQIEVARLLASHKDKLYIAYVMDKDYHAAKELAGEIGAKPVNDLDPILRDSSVSLTCMDVPYPERVQTVELITESGKDIFCLAPVASNLDDTNKILTQVRKNGVKLLAQFTPRCNPNVRSTRDLFREEGRELASIHFSIKQVKTSGGALLNPGSLALDFVRWFSGFEVANMYCEILNSDGSENVATIIGRLENGALMSLDAIRSYFDEMICEALYSDALLLLTPTNQSVHVELAGREKQDYPVIDSLRFAIEEIVTGREEGSWAHYEDIEAVASLVDQARLSAKEGRPASFER